MPKNKNAQKAKKQKDQLSENLIKAKKGKGQLVEKIEKPPNPINS